MRSPLPGITALLTALVLGAPLASAAPAHAPSTTTAKTVAARGAHPALRVTTVLGGLSHPWDVRRLDGRHLLVSQREPAWLTVIDRGRHHPVRFPRNRIWTSSETGLMGLAVDPGYRRSHKFYTCSGWRFGKGLARHDIRVNAWRMNPGTTRAHLIGPVVTGFPTTSGRHGGCRLLIARDGSMYVGTGDAASGTNPENLRSLGGKTLHLDPRTGRPWRTNPFRHAGSIRKRFVQTYGHRNVQGLAQRADGTVWSIEQGTDRDDEVNLLRNGGDYGYNPVPGYNESVPMTDQGLPGRQIAARWRSGYPTLAASGGTFVYGRQWRALNGALAVAMLKAERVVFMTFDKSGHLVRTTTPAALRQYGRIRTVVQLPGGRVLVCTDGDNGDGKVLAVAPR